MQDRSPFESLESSFRLLCDGPFPLTLEGRGLGRPFPPRPVPLGEVRARLLHPSTPFEARDRVMALLVRRSRRYGGKWTVALAGVLLPGLRAAVGPLLRSCPDPAELESETLVELLAAVASFEGEERVAARLMWKAAWKAKDRVSREAAAADRRRPAPLPAAPPRPWGHPDFVLDEAVEAEAITRRDADLIGETRLGGQTLAAWARANGVPEGTARMRRMRAESRLVEWIGKKRV